VVGHGPYSTQKLAENLAVATRVVGFTGSLVKEFGLYPLLIHNRVLFDPDAGGFRPPVPVFGTKYVKIYKS
jgi:hypothetical protein